MSFSELLKQCRKAGHQLEAELASKLGVTQQAVSKWGKRQVLSQSVCVATHCRAFLNTTADYLAGLCTAGKAMFPPRKMVLWQLF